MRRHVLRDLGSPAALTMEEARIPVPGKDEVRVQISATALGYVDALIARGRYQIRPELPSVPGGEISGVIDAVGADVDGFVAGDRVAAWLFAGGLAEYAIVPAAVLIRLPAGLEPACAAGMLVDYLTAHYALFARGGLQPGETVLVLGAAGGVGSAAVQLAARAGAYVIGSASSASKRDHAKAMGAHECIDTEAADWRDQLRQAVPGSGLDIVVDPVGGSKTEPAFRSLKKGGRHLVVGFASGEIPSLPINLALVKSASLIGVDVRHLVETDLPQAKMTWEWLFASGANGTLRSPTLDSWNFEDAGGALCRLEARDRVGKIIVSRRFNGSRAGDAGHPA